MSVTYDDAVARGARVRRRDLPRTRSTSRNSTRRSVTRTTGSTWTAGSRRSWASSTASPHGDIGALFKTVGMTLVSTVGGAGGPLYGTLFLQLGVATRGQDGADGRGLARRAHGGRRRACRRAGRPSRTTRRCWTRCGRPGLRSPRRLAEGASLPEALQRSAAAGEEGMKATIPLVARKGRASYLGERSAGHQDPGRDVVVPATEDRRRHLGRRLTCTTRRRRRHAMADYVGALDQGTTSTRFMIFDHAGAVKGVDQKEHEQIYPKPGWVEHDPKEIWTRCQEVIDGALPRPACRPRIWPRSGSRTSARRPSCGIATPVSRSTTPSCGRTRASRTSSTSSRPTAGRTASATRRGCRWRPTSPARRCAGSSTTSRAPAHAPRPASSPSATSTPGASGTSPVGSTAGVHVTDVSNASRTMLMNLATLDWDDDLLAAIGVPALDAARRSGPSSAVYGEAMGTLAGIPVAGDLGRPAGRDVRPGRLRRGRRQEHLRHRQLHAAQHRDRDGALQERPAHHGGLEARGRPGRVLPGGRDRDHGRARAVAAGQPRVDLDAPRRSRPWPNTVEDNGGIYFVPAFSGLFAPYWRGDARGAIVGMTRYVNKGHFARATLEATAWQTREVLDAMEADSGVKLKELKVDGGMVYNDTLMQFQADCLQVPGDPSQGRRDDGAGCRLRRRPRRGLLELLRGPARELGQGQGVDADRCRPTRSRPSTRCGRRPSRAPSTGRSKGRGPTARTRRGGRRTDRTAARRPHVHEEASMEKDDEHDEPKGKHEGDFAEGQEESEHDEDEHRGTFAEGQTGRRGSRHRRPEGLLRRGSSRGRGRGPQAQGDVRGGAVRGARALSRPEAGVPVR